MVNVIILNIIIWIVITVLVVYHLPIVSIQDVLIKVAWEVDVCNVLLQL